MQVSFIHMKKISWEQVLVGRCMCHGATNSYFWDATAGEYGGLIQKAWPERKSQIKPWQKHQLSGSFPEKKLKENLQECQEESKTEKREKNKTKQAFYLKHGFSKREEKYIKLLF